MCLNAISPRHYPFNLFLCYWNFYLVFVPRFRLVHCESYNQGSRVLPRSYNVYMGHSLEHLVSIFPYDLPKFTQMFENSYI